jgi:hypothetical protein
VEVNVFEDAGRMGVYTFVEDAPAWCSECNEESPLSEFFEE